MKGWCVYCGKLTTDPARECVKFGDLERDYGHDYTYEPAAVLVILQRRLAAIEEHAWEEA
jgi:hypothetical protein